MDAEMVKSAGPIPQHLSLVTLGVADVAAARAFYERLGFRAAAFDSADVAFFDMNGTILGLFGREALAEDAAVSAAGSGFRAVSCAFNLDSEAAVDKALAHAAACGCDDRSAGAQGVLGRVFRLLLRSRRPPLGDCIQSVLATRCRWPAAIAAAGEL
jgi:catechol 2,3-dioxygenase-like lactoylglutathione lyase family enzyme